MQLFANIRFDSSSSSRNIVTVIAQQLCCLLTGLSLNMWLGVQEFNRGLFDFLIATDDPASGKAPDTAADTTIDTAAEPAGELAAAGSQLAGEEDEAAVGNAQDQGQEPDHPWAEFAASAHSSKVGTWLPHHMTISSKKCTPY